MILCPADNTQHESEEALLKYVRFKLKMRQSDYFETYFPRFDKHTNEKIPFKTKDTYFETDFLNKRNMSAWFKVASKDLVASYSLELLERSKKTRLENGVDWAPSQVELRTIISPSVVTFEKSLQKSYNNICKDLNWKCLYDYGYVAKEFKPRPITIAIDTREQNELLLACQTVSNKLSYGDYTAMGADFCKVFIERKSLTDLAGSLSKGFDRLDREFKRAAEMDDHIIILCEESFSNFQSINYLPHTKKVKASYEFLAHQMRQLMRNNPNCQFLFVDGRKEASRIVLKILRDLAADSRTIDLQYYYDKKLL